MINLKTLIFSALLLIFFPLWADSNMDRLVYVKGEKLTSQDVLHQAEQQLGFRLTLKAPDRMAYVKNYDDLVSFGQIVAALTEYYRVHNGVVLEVANLGRGRYVFSSKENAVVEAPNKHQQDFSKDRPSLASNLNAVDLDMTPVEEPAKISRRELVQAEDSEIQQIAQLELPKAKVAGRSKNNSRKLGKINDPSPSPMDTQVQEENKIAEADNEKVKDLAVASEVSLMAPTSPTSSLADLPDFDAAPVASDDSKQLLEVEVLGRHIKAPDLEENVPSKPNAAKSDLTELEDVSVEAPPHAAQSFRSRMENLGFTGWSKWNCSLPKPPEFNGIKAIMPLSPALIGFVMTPNLFDDETTHGWGLASSFSSQKASSGLASADLNAGVMSPYYRWTFSQFTVENRLDAEVINGEVYNGRSQKWSGTTFTVPSFTSSIEKSWALPLDQTHLKSSLVMKLPLDQSLGVESSGSVDVGCYAGLEKKIDQARAWFQLGLVHCGSHDFYGDTQNVVLDGRMAVEQKWKEQIYHIGFTWAESPLKAQNAELLDGQITRFEIGWRDESGRLPFGVRLYVGASEASTDWGLSVDW